MPRRARQQASMTEILEAFLGFVPLNQTEHEDNAAALEEIFNIMGVNDAAEYLRDTDPSDFPQNLAAHIALCRLNDSEEPTEMNLDGMSSKQIKTEAMTKTISTIISMFRSCNGGLSMAIYNQLNACCDRLHCPKNLFTVSTIDTVLLSLCEFIAEIRQQNPPASNKAEKLTQLERLLAAAVDARVTSVQHKPKDMKELKKWCAYVVTKMKGARVTEIQTPFKRFLTEVVNMEVDSDLCSAYADAQDNARCRLFYLSTNKIVINLQKKLGRSVLLQLYALLEERAAQLPEGVQSDDAVLQFVFDDQRVKDCLRSFPTGAKLSPSAETKEFIAYFEEIVSDRLEHVIQVLVSYTQNDDPSRPIMAPFHKGLVKIIKAAIGTSSQKESFQILLDDLHSKVPFCVSTSFNPSMKNYGSCDVKFLNLEGIKQMNVDELFIVRIPTLSFFKRGQNVLKHMGDGEWSKATEQYPNLKTLSPMELRFQSKIQDIIQEQFRFLHANAEGELNDVNKSPHQKKIILSQLRTNEIKTLAPTWCSTIEQKIIVELRKQRESVSASTASGSGSVVVEEVVEAPLDNGEVEGPGQAIVEDEEEDDDLLRD